MMSIFDLFFVVVSYEFLQGLDVSLGNTSFLVKILVQPKEPEQHFYQGVLCAAPSTMLHRSLTQRFDFFIGRV